jgi:hypothetical protein
MLFTLQGASRRGVKAELQRSRDAAFRKCNALPDRIGEMLRRIFVECEAPRAARIQFERSSRKSGRFAERLGRTQTHIFEIRRARLETIAAKRDSRS